MQGTFRYNADNQTNHRRILVENVVVGSTVNVEDMTWAGIANNVLETWTLNKMIKCFNYSNGFL